MDSLKVSKLFLKNDLKDLSVGLHECVTQYNQILKQERLQSLTVNGESKKLRRVKINQLIKMACYLEVISKEEV